jgi:hypothetical protein
MANPTTPTTYRFDSATLKLIERLAKQLSVSKADVLRDSVSMLRDALVVASGDANAMLEVIRSRHPEAENLTIEVARGRDGNPELTVLIDGEEHPDVGARAAVIDKKAYVFLMIPDGSASIIVGVGNDALLLRPQFPVGEPTPWPTEESYGIVVSLGAPATVHAPAASKVKQLR